MHDRPSTDQSVEMCQRSAHEPSFHQWNIAIYGRHESKSATRMWVTIDLRICHGCDKSVCDEGTHRACTAEGASRAEEQAGADGSGNLRTKLMSICKEISVGVATHSNPGPSFSLVTRMEKKMRRCTYI